MPYVFRFVPPCRMNRYPLQFPRIYNEVRPRSSGPCVTGGRDAVYRTGIMLMTFPRTGIRRFLAGLLLCGLFGGPGGLTLPGGPGGPGGPGDPAFPGGLTLPGGQAHAQEDGNHPGDDHGSGDHRNRPRPGPGAGHRGEFHAVRGCRTVQRRGVPPDGDHGQPAEQRREDRGDTGRRKPRFQGRQLSAQQRIRSDSPGTDLRDRTEARRRDHLHGPHGARHGDLRVSSSASATSPNWISAASATRTVRGSPHSDA